MRFNCFRLIIAIRFLSVVHEIKWIIITIIMRVLTVESVYSLNIMF